ncbi:rRNA N(6)-adenosine-methyltransferase ZCCHC4-like [Tubulanus polymorphus]|uniref:rRNA N(6)-adenosine-methyltransferase ZCCHC4-like n=1 Tax=Tubulanus polymorphus TaxID=672921 RepID=UPI003DA32A0B
MNRNIQGIRFVDDEVEDKDQIPSCQHGPGLLFERYVQSGSGETRRRVERFYACSACRDRSRCSLYVPFGSKKFTNRGHYTLPFTHKQYYQRFSDSLCRAESYYCQTCEELIALKSNCDKHHEGHRIISGVSENMMRNPSEALLTPLDNNKTNAQYLFTSETVGFLVRTIVDRLKYKRVLCIGCPRIHEVLHHQYKSVSSLLLDMDHRFLQFFPPTQFCRYNVFNGHFFDGEDSVATYQQFLAEKELVVLIDPPFGGRIDVLSSTVRKIEADWRKQAQCDSEVLSLMLFCPYFMEPRILESLPAIKMLDFKVDYTNHATFHQTGNKNGSVVRVFTNISPRKIVIDLEGYRYCKKCKRSVYDENQHCNTCKSCTSKDGGRYIHCKRCKRCVKEKFIHCNQCVQCKPIDHKCGSNTTRCFICGENGHKVKDCPYQTTSKSNNESIKRVKNFDELKKRMKVTASADELESMECGRKLNNSAKRKKKR